jgi:hypothetical protein
MTESAPSEEKHCVFCGKTVERYHNYCDWDCHIGEAKRLGGRVHTPNGLPIKCIMADGTMLEIGHGDEPNYKWPVEVQYIGPITEAHREDARNMSGLNEVTDEEVRNFFGETHALLDTSGLSSGVATTMYECCDFTWDVQTGMLLSGPSYVKPGEWKLVSINPPTRPS